MLVYTAYTKLGIWIGMFFQGLCFDVICFGCHAPDETHKVETLRYVVHYFVLLFAGILQWLC